MTNSWDFPTDADKRLAEQQDMRPRWGTWAARYQRFLVLGTMKEAYNEERTAKGKGAAKSAPMAWGDMSRMFDWEGRRAKYQMYLGEQQRAEIEHAKKEERQEARQLRRQRARAAHGMYMSAVAKLQKYDEAQDKMVFDVSPAQAANFARIAELLNRDSRAEYDDLPTQRQEQISDQTIVHKWADDSSELFTDDD